jgi:hypothetical protein
MDKVTPIGTSVVHDVERPIAKITDKAEKCYQLWQQGRSYVEIAREVGYRNERSVYTAIQNRFGQEAALMSTEQRSSILALEMARLNTLQAAIWESALYGDLRSVAECRQLIMARAKLAGLDLVDPTVQKNLVLVVGGKEEDYIAALKGMSED